MAEQITPYEFVRNRIFDGVRDVYNPPINFKVLIPSTIEFEEARYVADRLTQMNLGQFSFRQLFFWETGHLQDVLNQGLVPAVYQGQPEPVALVEVIDDVGGARLAATRLRMPNQLQEPFLAEGLEGRLNAIGRLAEMHYQPDVPLSQGLIDIAFNALIRDEARHRGIELFPEIEHSVDVAS